MKENKLENKNGYYYPIDRAIRILDKIIKIYQPAVTKFLEGIQQLDNKDDLIFVRILPEKLTQKQVEGVKKLSNLYSEFTNFYLEKIKPKLEKLQKFCDYEEKNIAGICLSTGIISRKIAMDMENNPIIDKFDFGNATSNSLFSEITFDKGQQNLDVRSTTKLITGAKRGDEEIKEKINAFTEKQTDDFSLQAAQLSYKVLIDFQAILGSFDSFGYICFVVEKYCINKLSKKDSKSEFFLEKNKFSIANDDAIAVLAKALDLPYRDVLTQGINYGSYNVLEGYNKENVVSLIKKNKIYSPIFETIKSLEQFRHSLLILQLQSEYQDIQNLLKSNIKGSFFEHDYIRDNKIINNLIDRIKNDKDNLANSLETEEDQQLILFIENFINSTDTKQKIEEQKIDESGYEADNDEPKGINFDN